MTDIGTLGGFMAEANDINTGGTIVGTAQTSTGPWHAFLWDGLMHDLAPLSGFATALGINNRGEVVGQADGHAFLYSDGRFIDLNTQVSTTTSGWTFASAHDINDSGQIVGVGLHNGQPRVFRLTQTLLARYAPEMRFAFDETYHPVRRGTGDGHVLHDRPGAHEYVRAARRLRQHDRARIRGPGRPGGSTLALVPRRRPVQGRLHQRAKVEGDSKKSAANDYVAMLQLHPGVYDDRMYARVVQDPQGSGDRILQYWFY